MNLTGIWEGTLDGTNWGRLTAKLSERDDFIRGVAEISDIGIGTFHLDVTGSRSSGRPTLHLSPGRSGVRTYPGTIDVQLLSETAQAIRGDWRTSIGTSGTLRAERRDMPEISPEAVAKKVAEANAAFVIMAFSDQAGGFIPTVDILSAIKRGCQAANVRAHRVDEVEHSGSITKLLLEQIKRHRFLISDLTHERPNVYYEVGYAHGLEKDVILTAHKGSPIHFDIASYNVILYSSATELEQRIAKRLESLIANEGNVL